MKNLLTTLLLLISTISFSQNSNYVNANKFNQDFGKIIQDLSDNYIYLKDKKTDFDCVKNRYSKIINQVKTPQERVLFFEYLLNEFYDSNLTLGKTIKSSFRLHSPIYVVLKEGKFFIKNVWQSQIKSFDKNIIGAEVLNFNSREFNRVIDNFPAQCVNKKIPEVREWIANKIISGRLNESRILTLRLKSNKKISFNVGKIAIRKERNLMSVYEKNGIAVIKINNSLSSKGLMKQFDNHLDGLLRTQGLILDLRNTVDEGDSYMARAIMSRFIDKELAYQKHVSKENYANNLEIKKSRLAFVNPRGKQYTKPVVVLVSRWTGSVAETIAIGLDGMKRAKIVGTEMRKMPGATVNYSFKNQKFGYRISTDKLYHVTGLPRENFVPAYTVNQKNTSKDEILEKAFYLIKLGENNNFALKLESKNNLVSKLDK